MIVLGVCFSSEKLALSNSAASTLKVMRIPIMKASTVLRIAVGKDVGRGS